LQWRKLRAESPRQGKSRAARHASTHPVPSGRSHPLVSDPARWAGLTNRAPVVLRTAFAERTATLSTSKGRNSEAPQPGAFAHSIQRRAEGKPPKALLGAGCSRADGPAFLSPARKGWVWCIGGSCGLKVRDSVGAGLHATPPPIPSLQAGVPFGFLPSPLGWANESRTGGAQNAVRRKDRNTQRQQRPQLGRSSFCCFYPLHSAKSRQASSLARKVH